MCGIVGLYRKENTSSIKITLYSPKENFDWLNFAEVLEKSFNRKSSIIKISSHAILKTELDSNIFREWIKTNFSEVKIMSVGNALEIYKEIGMPGEVIERFNLLEMQGS